MGKITGLYIGITSYITHSIFTVACMNSSYMTLVLYERTDTTGNELCSSRCWFVCILLWTSMYT